MSEFTRHSAEEEFATSTTMTAERPDTDCLRATDDQTYIPFASHMIH
jgi:hypothetical protein